MQIKATYQRPGHSMANYTVWTFNWVQIIFPYEELRFHENCLTFGTKIKEICKKKVNRNENITSKDQSYGIHSFEKDVCNLIVGRI